MFQTIIRLLLLPFVIVARLIFWLLLAFAALILLKRLGRKRTPPLRENSGARPIETMVACARCGLLLPESESLRAGEQHFCCEEHRRGR